MYTHTQGQKLSRYSRQAHELIENGGPGLGEEDLVSEIILGPDHKRQRLQMMNRVGDDITVGMELTHNNDGPL